MSKSSVRQYKSPLRERQANQTRINISLATERLLLSNGYAKMTVDAIAKEARVSTQTVYAVFGSKRGIIADLLDRVVYKEHFQDLYERCITTADMLEALKLTLSLIRQMYESEHDVYALLRGAGVLDPELAALATNRETRRREFQKQHVEYLLAGKQFRKERSMSEAQDIFWCLTSRDIYRMMVQERGWSGDAYEAWLLNLLTRALLDLLEV